MAYVAYENNAVEAEATVCNGELEPISRTDPEAVAVRIFLLDDERDELKIACDRTGITMSHLARTLLLEWLRSSKDEA